MSPQLVSSLTHFFVAWLKGRLMLGPVSSPVSLKAKRFMKRIEFCSRRLVIWLLATQIMLMAGRTWTNTYAGFSEAAGGPDGTHFTVSCPFARCSSGSRSCTWDDQVDVILTSRCKAAARTA
jgi:hypothetical protein